MMDCEKMNDLLEMYLDGTLTEAEAQEVEQHAKGCPDCMRMLSMCRDLRREEGNVPEDFASSWRQMIRKEEQMEMKQRNGKTFKSVLALAAAFVFIVGGTLLTREQRADKEADYGVNYTYTTAAAANGAAYKRAAPQVMMAVEESADFAMDTAAPEMAEAEREQKLIRRVDFTIRTLEFDRVLENIQNMTASVGGRVEFLSQYGDASSGALRNANLTLRIPAEKLDGFLTDVENVGNITSFTNQVEDVSDSYYDVQARLDTQLIKMERLQKLLAEATEVSDLIEIESSIADTQYLIDSYQGRLKGMDDQVDYSTVTVYVQETRVVETKEASFWQRVGDGLAASVEEGLAFLEDVSVFLLSAAPWIIVVVLVVFAVKIIRKKKK